MLSEVQEQARGVAYLRRVVANQCKIPLLLVGDEGVGKKFSVLEAIKEDFSEGDPSDNQCLQVARGNHPDLTFLVSSGGKEIGIDEVRDALVEAKVHPMVARRRYIVIDGADQLTEAAANAVLKILEEPPRGTRFILLANSTERVIPTIISRCGEVRYNRLSEAFIASTLSQLTDDPMKALVYTRMSEGSVGRAVQFLGSNRISFRNRVLGIIKMALTDDLSSLFGAIDEMVPEKKTSEQKDAELLLAIRFLEHLVLDLLLIPHAPDRITNMDLREELTALCGKIGPTRLSALRREISVVQDRLRTKANLAHQIKNCFSVAFSER